MAIDHYDRVADNLAAIAATLEATRAIERHGGGTILERAFIGFAQLSAAIVTARPWREVLGLDDGVDYEADEIDAAFRAKAKQVHPDAGGDHERMTELNIARAEALKELSHVSPSKRLAEETFIESTDCYMRLDALILRCEACHSEFVCYDADDGTQSPKFCPNCGRRNAA